MAITIIESKRGVNWLIGNDNSRDKGEKRKATLYALKRNQDRNIENFKMWIKTRLYFRYSCINEKNKTLIPAYVRSCMVTICTLAFQARTRAQSLVEPLKVLQYLPLH
jgi:hypothetical protein